MNERIKECWLKAAREDSGDKWDTQEEFIERFARLIVRECAEVGNSGDPLQDGEIARMIKQHFGVES
jgi:hypothetical protein